MPTSLIPILEEYLNACKTAHQIALDEHKCLKGSQKIPDALLKQKEQVSEYFKAANAELQRLNKEMPRTPLPKEEVLITEARKWIRETHALTRDNEALFLRAMEPIIQNANFVPDQSKVQQIYQKQVPLQPVTTSTHERGEAQES